MANEEQLAILRQGVEVWNTWRDENLGAEIKLSKANLSKANLSNAHLLKADLKRADLSKADLKEADLRAADLSKANLKEADLREVALRIAYLRKADFSVADLREADLSRADLGEASLREANLKGADLSEAHLKGADLREANLKGADLRKADLRKADLRRANLEGADLSETDLSNLDLTGVTLQQVTLRGSKFSKVVTGSTIFGNLDLSETIGLEDVIHHGPSSISTDTITLSKGKIPKVFLRGCGLSDWAIESAKLANPDLSNEEINSILYKLYDLRATLALQISPLFISYSHADSAFVDRIGDCLTVRGIRYWRDIHDMKAGRLEKQIDRAIRQNPTVLLILSKHSLRSDWVEHEVRTARQLEKEMNRDVLCPVSLDDRWKNSRWPKHVMEQVMEYNILDFSNWTDGEKFGNTFNKLIDGLGLFYK